MGKTQKELFEEHVKPIVLQLHETCEKHGINYVFAAAVHTEKDVESGHDEIALSSIVASKKGGPTLTGMALLADPEMAPKMPPMMKALLLMKIVLHEKNAPDLPAVREMLQKAGLEGLK